ncbi:hypothetical protein BN14_04787 [Rhizoctonia solani AG-1 IB]|uniref:Uncharacterized protein n=1 Tax=Thanatephorus cucumeris (strain AG1-IB / isolate 7/3/14) TaxID=1108050 RepID=M5C4D2_THACB|nr:hypothetical protein BN14_04787 [Rhizoctonia solani AG-1 IB]
MTQTTSNYERPSHIPRPSIQSIASYDTPKRRPRTHSTPRPFDRDMLTPASSRPASPAVTATARPSRIPTRPRAGSRPIPTEFPPSPDPSPDLWPVSENAIRTQLTPPTPDRPAHRRKRDTFVPPPPDDADEILFDEPAPFTVNSNSLAGRSSIDEYEHWYRGEGRGGGGRNGGHGEIRIATRTEMLEIASFGHPTSRNNSRGHYGEFGWRSKAYDDSTVGTRFRWPDENEVSVLDEAPLTDLDDFDTESYNPGSQDARSIEIRSIESYQPLDVRSEEQYTLEDARSAELDPEPDKRPEPTTPAKPLPSRIARATSPPIGPATSTPSLVSRAGQSPTPSKARTTKAQSPAPKGQSPPPKSAQSPKGAQSPKSPKPKSAGRRGTNASTTSKSPSRAGTSQLSPNPTSTPKTPRTGAPSLGKITTTPSPRTRVQSSGTKSNGTKRTKKLSTTGSSVGPSSPHSLADAIPQIFPEQQIPNDGNWDDVVLPTIARRMQGGDVVMLERKPIEEELLPPAPGTFGYEEKEKARKEYDERRSSGTEFEEFGGWDGIPKKPKTVEKPKVVEKAEERRNAPSPPPFSDYTPIPPVAKPPEPTPAPVMQPMTISEAELRQDTAGRPKDDSHGSGCCKCVVM